MPCRDNLNFLSSRKILMHKCSTPGTVHNVFTCGVEIFTLMVYNMVTFCMSSCSLQHSGMYLYGLSSAHSKIGILCMVFKGIINNLNGLSSAHSRIGILVYGL